MLEAVNCGKEESGTLLTSTADEVLPHYIRRSQSSNGFVITLYNTKDGEREFVYTSPDKKVRNAFLVNMLDEVIEAVPTKDKSVRVILPARSLKKLRIELE